MKLKITEKPLAAITPYDKNPRNNDEAVQPVAESIRQFGFKVPIIIDAQGVIVAGHTRYRAAQLLKLKTVPCIVANDLTPEQISAFRLADNKTAEFAEWDFELLNDELDALTDFDMAEFGFYSIVEDTEFDHLFTPQPQVQQQPQKQAQEQTTTDTPPEQSQSAPPLQPQEEERAGEITYNAEKPRIDAPQTTGAPFRVIIAMESAEAAHALISRLTAEGYDAQEWKGGGES